MLVFCATPSDALFDVCPPPQRCVINRIVAGSALQVRTIGAGSQHSGCHQAADFFTILAPEMPAAAQPEFCVTSSVFC